jgi:hypothetical protein
MESNPRKLIPNERNKVGQLMFKKWPNIDLWNPKYSATRITSGTILKIWDSTFELAWECISNKFGMRGTNMQKTIELSSLLDTSLGKELDRDEQIKILINGDPFLAWDDKKWLSNIKLIILSSLREPKVEHLAFLTNQTKRGASCFSIIQHHNRIAKSFPIIWCPSPHVKENIDDIVNTVWWAIRKIANRNTRIWSPLTSVEIEGTRLCREGATDFACYQGNTACLGKVFAWFTKNMGDARNGCLSSCEKIVETQESDLEPASKRRKLETISSGSLPSLTDLVTVNEPVMLHYPQGFWDKSDDGHETSTDSILEAKVLKLPTKAAQ